MTKKKIDNEFKSLQAPEHHQFVYTQEKQMEITYRTCPKGLGASKNETSTYWKD
jgi:hypothetical protein